MSSAAPQGEAHKSTDKEERKKMRRQRVQKSANKSETIIDRVCFQYAVQLGSVS